uniref:ATP synthase F0 subunit 8 n=1 Tax=Muda kuroiwae TaxID=2170272 RepID=A0A344ALU6_9HEMI|nr:ATP synthase F0 subunit 8 [Muda kuroiwae]
MPQMSPMYWMFLYIYFILTLFLVLLLIYFIFNNKSFYDIIKNDQFEMIWLW